MVWVPGAMKKAAPSQTRIIFAGRTYVYWDAAGTKEAAEEMAKKLRRRVHPDYPGFMMRAAVIDRGKTTRTRRYAVFVSKGSKKRVAKPKEKGEMTTCREKGISR